MLTWLVVPMHHRPSFAAEKDTTRGFLFSELSVEIASQRGLQPLPRALPEVTADAV